MYVAQTTGGCVSLYTVTGRLIHDGDTSGTTRLDVLAAIEEGKSLRDADLRNLHLNDVDLSHQDLTGADLRGANLSRTKLNGTVLTCARLNANIDNLRDAYLDEIKIDYYRILNNTTDTERVVLISALNDGLFDGRAYYGECSCIIGTIASMRECSYDELDNITPDDQCPIETFCKGIERGDTPDNNQISALLVEWTKNFDERK
jgi:hypothetical protein